MPDPPCTGDLDRRHWMCTSFTAQFGEMRPRRHFTEPGEGSWEHPTAEWRLPCTERVEIVSGVGTQGAPHEHPCGISGPQSRAPPLPEYPHSTNPRTLTHVDGLNLDASASPAPQESAPGCFSDSSWGVNHNC